MIIFKSQNAIVDFVDRSAENLPMSIDQKMINTFAKLTHDQRWIHVDIGT